MLVCFSAFAECGCLLTCFAAFSQSGAAINTTGSAADASAILDVSSTSAGMLIPRMTKSDRNAIGTPAEGLLIYQTDDTIGFWYHSSGTWKLMGSGAGSAIVNGTAAGNTLYWDGLQWLESSNIYNTGASVGINTNAPDASALVDMSSTTKGALIPRMTTAERNLIGSPAEGLQIYNTTTKCLEVYIPPIWQSTYCGCTPPASPSSNTHTPSQTEIVWDWSDVTGAVGYQWNTTNTYPGIGINIVSNSTYTQSGLTCNTSYTLYVWAYNNCGESQALVLNENTTSCFTCGVDNLVDSRDANSYQTVQIGTQCWMKENLKYLPTVVGPAIGSINDPYYYVYGYSGTDVNIAKSQANYTTYGVLYNWHAASGGTTSSANPSGVQGVCPSGWHLPSDAEWKQLEIYLGMDPSVANTTGLRGTNQGDQLKSTTLWTAGGSATNSSGFTALPGGRRLTGGSFNYIGGYGDWWSATEDGSGAWRRDLNYDVATVYRGTGGKGDGYAVRCLRD